MREVSEELHTVTGNARIVHINALTHLQTHEDCCPLCSLTHALQLCGVVPPEEEWWVSLYSRIRMMRDECVDEVQDINADDNINYEKSVPSANDNTDISSEPHIIDG